MLIRLIALCGLLLSPLAGLAAEAPAADAPPVFDTTGVDLYLPQKVMAQRVSVDDMATYTKALQAAAEDYFTSQKDPWKEDLAIVVAVKPGPQARVWLVSWVLPDPNDRLAALRDKLAAIPPPPVTGGPVAFCIDVAIAGGNGKPPSTAGSPPMPKEWTDALAKGASNKPVPFDDLMALIGATPPVNSWDKQAGQLMIGGFMIFVVIAAFFFYQRNRSVRRR
jgi:hypothetical protein